MEWRIRESRESSDLEQTRRRIREMIEELEAEEEARITAQEIVREVQEQRREMGERENLETPTAQELIRDGLARRNVGEVDEQHNIDRLVEEALDAIEADDDFEKRKGRAIESLKENLRVLSSETMEKSDDEAKDVPHVGEVKSVRDFYAGLENHMELKLRRGFEKNHQDAIEYLKDDVETESSEEKPALVEKIEQLEMRRLYEEAHGNPPEVSFESMHDVDRLLKEHSEKLPDIADSAYKQCEIYFDVKGDWSKTRKELSEVHRICHTYIGDWRAGKDTPLMARLRELEEDRICREWAESREAHDFAKNLKSLRLEQKSTWEQTTLEELSRNRISVERVREQFESLTDEETWTNEKLASAIRDAFDKSSQGFFGYAELKDIGWDKQRVKELQEHIRSNQKELETLAGEELDKSKIETLRLAVIDERLYSWIVKTRGDELIGPTRINTSISRKKAISLRLSVISKTDFRLKDQCMRLISIPIDS